MLRKQKVDKRQRNDDEQAAKRQKGDDALPIYATKFTKEELKDEQRKPKKKVAVLIGYAGTGYRGMQLTHDQKTIEGDLFQAFVAAGAISKANADDPKKSSFVRCARTDKGVHAAGNVISLKLIVEDEDIVKKINDNLVPQIRIWGIERTNNSFSAYQLVDSRIYEYLIPSHSFLPPHPRSFLGRKCAEWAQKKDDHDSWKARQEEVDDYWEKVDQETIKPILQEYNEEMRSILEKALYLQEDGDRSSAQATTTTAASQTDEMKETLNSESADATVVEKEKHAPKPEENGVDDEQGQTTSGLTIEEKRQRSQDITEASKRLKAAYLAAKRAYHIPEKRLHRVKDCLNMFVGTHNYHNFTIDKPFRDPSAKRIIKSFNANPTPILINGTEWLSLKVHGQSFMMHQIRKMVGMVALIVRCGCDPNRMKESFGPDVFSIPKAPALGLLLERPIFDSYNKMAKSEFGKEGVSFEKYATEMDDFKQREIYERMYRDEEKENVFGNFFNHVDSFPEPTFLFVTSGGLEATKSMGGDQNERSQKQALVDADGEGESDNDADKTRDDKLGNEG